MLGASCVAAREEVPDGVLAPFTPPARCRPRGQRTYRTHLGCTRARDRDARPASDLVVFRSPEMDNRAFGGERDVLDVGRADLASAQRPRRSDQ